jgi:hypothetical protein
MKKSSRFSFSHTRMEAVEDDEPVRIYRAPELSVEERRALAAQFLRCAVCQKSLQRLETAVSCERCEIRRYCSEAHRDDARDRGHVCIPVPDAFKGMGASVARNLDAITLALIVMNRRGRVDARASVEPELLRGVAHDLLASFFDVAYRGVVLVPMARANMIEHPAVQMQLAPDYGQALFDNLMLRKAVHLVLDNASTEEEREAEALREQEHPTAYYLQQAMRMYLPILLNVMERMPYEEHPNDPAARKAMQRSMALMFRRFVVALTNVKRDAQLNDVGAYLAGLERQYGTLFAPWKRTEGEEKRDLPTVEEIVVDDEEEDIFSDIEEEDEEHFVDAEEFKARFMSMFGGKEKEKKTRERSGSVGSAVGTNPDPDGDGDDEPVDAERLFNRSHCLCRVIPLTEAGAILATGLIDLFLRVKMAEQHHLVLRKQSEDADTIARKWAMTKKNVAYIVPLGSRAKIEVSGEIPIDTIKQSVYKNVGVTDPAYLYAKTSKGNAPTLEYASDAWWHRFVQPLRMVSLSPRMCCCRLSDPCLRENRRSRQTYHRP